MKSVLIVLMVTFVWLTYVAAPLYGFWPFDSNEKLMEGDWDMDGGNRLTFEKGLMFVKSSGTVIFSYSFVKSDTIRFKRQNTEFLATVEFPSTDTMVICRGVGEAKEKMWSFRRPGTVQTHIKPPSKPPCVHCAVIMNEDGPKRVVRDFEVEFWQKGDLIRIEANRGGKLVVQIIRGSEKFNYTQGASEGAKTRLTQCTAAEMNPVLVGIVARKRGTKLGSEIVEGMECNKYETYEGNARIISWVVESRADYVPYVVKNYGESIDNGVKQSSTTIYRNVQLSTDLSDDLFIPPSSVIFTEVSPLGP
jgi:hypothetical protein